MSLTQLSPPWPVFVEGRGAGYAMAVIDYSQEHHLLFVVAMDATGEIWTVPNPDVRLQWNPSMGRVQRPAPVSLPSVLGPAPSPCPDLAWLEKEKEIFVKKMDPAHVDGFVKNHRPGWEAASGVARPDHHPADGVVLEIRVRPNGPEGYSEWESRCTDHPELDGFRDEVLPHLLRRLADVKISGFPSHVGRPAPRRDAEREKV